MPKPLSVPADGNLLVLWVPAIANPATPTVAELTAGTVVDLTCYIRLGGYNPSVSEDTVDDKRLCDTENYSQPGRITRSLEITYNTNILSAVNDKAALALTERAVGNIVERWGVPYDQVVAVADKVNVLPVTCGAQRDLPPEENGKLGITQSLSPRDKYYRRVAVIA